MTSASEMPRLGPVIESSEPWMTSTGHFTRAASSRVPSGVSPPSCVAMRVSGVVSSPQPTQSSTGLVECGSVNIFEKKNSRKPR